MNRRLRIALIGFFISFSSYGQANYNYWVLEQSLPSWAIGAFKHSNVETRLNISDFINPLYFEEDFDGDSELDIAILVEHKQTHKKGIIIIHRLTEDFFLIGVDEPSEHKIEDLSWMEVWKIYRKSKAHRLTYTEDSDIEGSVEISVHNPCIEIVKLEASSGLIYWDGNKYRLAITSE